MKTKSAPPSREHILSEIRRLAAATPGEAVGRARFTKESGIKRSAWEGRYWAIWSEGLEEAGISSDTLDQTLDEDARQAAEFSMGGTAAVVQERLRELRARRESAPGD